MLRILLCACLALSVPVLKAQEAGQETTDGSSTKEKIKRPFKEGAKAVGDAAVKVGHAVRDGAKKVGHGVKEGAHAVGHGVKKVVKPNDKPDD